MRKIQKDKQGRRFFVTEIRFDDGRTEQRRVYEKICSVCETKDFLVPEVNTCGPCCFGDASTAGGNW